MKNKTKYYRTDEFIELQNKWYTKLSLSGFNDLEWLDKTSGVGQNSPFLLKKLKNFNNIDASELQTTLEHYNNAQTYLTHGKFKSRLKKFIWELYCDGVSYRQMIPIIRSRNFKYVPSIRWISVTINDMYLDMAEFITKNFPTDYTEPLESFMSSNVPIDMEEGT